MRQLAQQLDLVQTGIFLCLRRYSSDGYAANHDIGGPLDQATNQTFLGFASIADKASRFQVRFHPEVKGQDCDR